MDTYGWDTVYCLNMDRVNSVLAANMVKLPPMYINWFDEDIHAILQCDFAPCSIITGGSEKQLRMQIPIKEGILLINGKPKKLSNVAVVVQVYLHLIPSALDSQKHELKFNLKEVGDINNSKEGVVSPISIEDPNGCLSPMAKEIVLSLIPKHLVENASQVSHVFAQINYVRPNTNSWLAPKKCTYAYVEGQDGKGSLAILSVTTDRDISGLPHKVDPDIISGSVNAGYLISKELFMKNVILPMLPSMYPGTGPDKFYVNSENCIVNNGNFDTNSVTSGLITYHPKISSLNLSIYGGDLKTCIRGFCDMYAGISMEYGIDTRNTSRYNPDNRSIAFERDNNPISYHNADLPWYFAWWLSPIVSLIVNIIVPIIANSILQTLQSNSQSFVTSPPVSIAWTGVNTSMDVISAGINDSYYMKGRL